MKNIEVQIKEDPSLIFTLMKEEKYSLVESLLLENLVNINTVDRVGNNVVMKLLKLKRYELVLEVMKKRNWDVNHQNEEGNTFGHLLAQDDSLMAVQVMEQLTKKKNYLPNMKNHRGETAMDIALSNHYLATAFKLLEDKRFNDINIFSFRHLFHASIKNELYGKYSKLTNFEIIVDQLEKKELDSKMSDLVKQIHQNKEAIREDILYHHSSLLETIIENHLAYR